MQKKHQIFLKKYMNYASIIVENYEIKIVRKYIKFDRIDIHNLSLT